MTTTTATTTSPAARAIAALDEAADALDALPAAMRRVGILGPVVVAQQLRNEARHISDLVDVIAEAARGGVR